MDWIIIGVVLLAAFGPVLWLVPSRRDRKLARMRTRARSRGLAVEVTSIADPNPAPEARVSAGGVQRNPVIAGTTYRLDLPRAAPLAAKWALLRAEGAGPAAVAGWRWDDGANAAGVDWSEVAAILARLPGDVLRCAADGRGVGCFWRERTSDAEAESAVDRLAECLLALAQIQQTHHAARQAERDAERLMHAPPEPGSDRSSS